MKNGLLGPFKIMKQKHLDGQGNYRCDKKSVGENRYYFTWARCISMHFAQRATKKGQFYSTGH